MIKQFSYEFQKLLVSKNMNARQIHVHLKSQGHRGSEKYVNDLAKGRELPAPVMIDHIAKIMNLNTQERVRLHRAVALDKGYQIGSVEG